MKVTSNPDTRSANGTAPGAEQAKPRRRFSELLNSRDDPHSGQSADDVGAESIGPEDRGKRAFPALKDASAAAPAFAPALPSGGPPPVSLGQSAAVRSDALLSSLVREIHVQAPPGSGGSVDIQFDSRTLEGLHVRVQKTNQGVEVKLSTSSEAVSRLLTANTQSLTEALAQRGYAAPVVSVQRTETPAGTSARPSRDARDRGGSSDRGSGQKRR
jgi:hypothetical protein